MLNRALILTIALTTACATDELFDPTGTWAMNGRYGTGTCQPSSPAFTVDVLIAESRGDYVATTAVPNETTTGTIATGETSAQINLTMRNSDVLGDGRVQGVATLQASSDENLAITGSGTLSLSGAVSCSHSYSVTGTLR